MPKRNAPVPHKIASTNANDFLRLAAIDVGSNSIHMIVAQTDPDGAITTLWRMKEMVGLGRLSFPSHKLSDHAMDRAIATLERFGTAARQRGCEKVIAVATSAVREASNGGAFIDRASRELNTFIKVVSAREEARLIYLAVRHAIPMGDQPHLVIDIGGGSVEFIVGNDRNAQLLESRKLGAARMTARFVHSDPISDADRKALLSHYDRELSIVTDEILRLKPVRVIGTSGTLESIATMCAALAGEEVDSDTPGVIERGQVSSLLDLLIKSDSAHRQKLVGLDEQRRDQILAGTLLVDEIFRRLKIKRIQMCRPALREGIILDYLNRHAPELATRHEVPDPRKRSVIDLARRCNWNKQHAEQVARLTVRLFDQLISLHRLGPRQRELIEYAAMLHDIGLHIDRDDHHKHSEYLILHGRLKGFRTNEIAVIASIARYHRKTSPRKKHELYALMTPGDRHLVDVGASLLRIADGLDRSHSMAVQDIVCSTGGQKVECQIVTQADAEYELWGARQKSELFTETFGRTFEVELASRRVKS